MQWDSTYKADGLVWGDKPSELAVFAVRYLNEFSPPDKILEIVDVGCGYGRDAAFLSASVSCHVLGIDNSREAIALAMKRLGGVVGGVRFQCCDFRQMTDSRFDVIFASNLYQLLASEDRRAFRELVGRALKSGGMLFLSTLSTSDPEHFGKGEPVPDDENSFRDENFHHFCTAEELARDFGFLSLKQLYEHEYYEARSNGATHHHVSWLLLGVRQPR